MITLYKPGTGWLHRMPAGPKAAGILVVVLAISLLPTSWWSAGVAAVVVVLAYLLSGLGLRELGRQTIAVRWIIVITLAAQLLFLPTEAAVANSIRVVAALLLASLLVLSTRVADLLDAFERALGPFRRLGLDPSRVALMLAVAVNTIPVLARLATTVREAQRARGVRTGPVAFVVPFLVVALKHADELGEALTARGVR
ncbi:energy-coupling factor transporter transmembrane protein EcfT [Herbiconiux sp. KACC 21604]|uniref:energy-coupling factor transporter transmembrane component T family protein n=1 Tax=unclassified Herbiconiux TaxID=2618217 RepID=UPI001490A7C1|nr:energy-coupling factor transporter transmembrane protein EcfT [Herbiconiux sp. SALV-R1]QJU55211.1 energy-coupling factor transporter transmembrane protein EcfT [Herbiconiux sp. SALV-R1]WPO86376.1 energy-coupling factor transporter transmembrane protein EcfT [Herbiconiux sp. KACC 21604]